MSIFSGRYRARCGRSLSSRASAPLAFMLGLGWPLESAIAEPAADPPPALTQSPSDAPPGTPQTPAAPGAAAPADAPAPLAESLRGSARADYAAARILYEDGDFEGALTKLEAAYGASRDPRLLWNMAACAKELRHYASVVDLLERYLKEGAALIGEEERKATHDLVETVREFVNELRLDVQPAGTRVLVDGVQVATTPLDKPLWVDMGKRRLRFEQEGFVAYETEMELSGGKSIALNVRLEKELHGGTLHIVSDAHAVIRIDGKVEGTGMWSGQLTSGTHSVEITEPGKQTHKSEVVIRDHDTSSLHVNLIDEPHAPGAYIKDSSSGVLWWIAGGVALAGAGVGTYFLLRPGDEPAQPDCGTLGCFDL